MTATGRDTQAIRGALTREDAIDWAIRRWTDIGWRVLTPREDIEVRMPGPRYWKVTADVETVRPKWTIVGESS